MARTSTRSPSAGLLLYRYDADGLAVLLVHPGGPFWRNKDAGAWQIPKGRIEDGEEPAAAAAREFEEETGIAVDGPLIPLGSFRQAGGKQVHLFIGEGDLDPAAIQSILFEVEWPPRSGTMKSFPEVDRASWFDLASARAMMLPSQAVALDRLEEFLKRD